MSLIWKGITVTARRLHEESPRVVWLWLYEKFVRIRDGVSPAETSRVTDRLFVGGQHRPRGLAAMRAWGIGATVNLREEADDDARGLAMSRHLWLPTPDDGAPTLEQLREGVAFIREAVQAGEGVYIHCAQGVGRAPMMAAAYLVSEGHTPRAALETIRRVRPFITPTREQLKRLEEWAKSTTDDGRKTTADAVVGRPSLAVGQ
jgi:protein-tyrosine phosphatase